MIDLDTLRAGLRDEADQPLAAVDIAKVMAAGRRIRWRRRLLAGSAVTAVTAAVVVVTAMAGNGGAAAGQRSVTGAPGGAASTSATPDSGVLGELIHTGIRTAQGELVIYGVPVDEAQLPGIHFGFMAGAGQPPAPLVETNETAGSDRGPGFHAVEGGIVTNGVAVPEFGYYVGPAAKITAAVGGRRIQAHHATWSEDSSVVVFWFDPADVKPGTDATHLAAYDANGRALPAGDNGVGHG